MLSSSLRAANAAKMCIRDSILFVMRYARKVKADKGSTILTLQERETMRAQFGEVKLEAEEAEANPKEALMTVRQKWTLAVFGLTFVVMIIGFIPWEDFGINLFNAGAISEEVTETVSGDDVSSAVSYTHLDVYKRQCLCGRSRCVHGQVLP